MRKIREEKEMTITSQNFDQEPPSITSITSKNSPQGIKTPQVIQDTKHIDQI